jgi:DNA repair protein SbcC/Rad50
MKFQDFFVPKWQHSNPEVRKNAVAKLTDTKLLKQIAKLDAEPMVRETALAQLTEQVHLSERQ